MPKMPLSLFRMKKFASWESALRYGLRAQRSSRGHRGDCQSGSQWIVRDPTLYTTYSRAIQYIPSMRFTISYILVEPKSSGAIPHIQEQVRLLGYQALTQDQLCKNRQLL